jgi:hypothetical protein
MMPQPMVRIRTITRSGCREIEQDRAATMRAETIVESDTMMVHTILYPDGSGSVVTHRRAAGDHGWIFDTRVEFSETRPTQAVPRRALARLPLEDTRPHSVCAADHYLGS